MKKLTRSPEFYDLNYQTLSMLDDTIFGYKEKEAWFGPEIDVWPYPEVVKAGILTMTFGSFNGVVATSKLVRLIKELWLRIVSDDGKVKTNIEPIGELFGLTFYFDGREESTWRAVMDFEDALKTFVKYENEVRGLNFTITSYGTIGTLHKKHGYWTSDDIYRAQKIVLDNDASFRGSVAFDDKVIFKIFYSEDRKKNETYKLIEKVEGTTFSFYKGENYDAIMGL
jgi:hypothetical protein